MDKLLDKILIAHGGIERWNMFKTTSATIRFGGLAFASKFNKKGLRSRRFHISTKRPEVIVEEFPKHGQRGIFTADLVRIETQDGITIKERKNPRYAFKNIRRNFWWDDLDLLYFCGYAIWNYLNSPFLLTQDGIQIRDSGFWNENGEVWKKLEAIFPDDFPTHCKKQVFYFDSNNQMRRLDYDPEVFASWAKAAHYCSDLNFFSGLLFPTKRKVVPRTMSGRSKPKPLLVWIEVKDVQLLT